MNWLSLWSSYFTPLTSCRLSSFIDCLISLPFSHAYCLSHTHTRAHTHTNTHTHSVSARVCLPEEYWNFIVQHTGSGDYSQQKAALTHSNDVPAEFRQTAPPASCPGWDKRGRWLQIRSKFSFLFDAFVFLVSALLLKLPLPTSHDRYNNASVSISRKYNESFDPFMFHKPTKCFFPSYSKRTVMSVSGLKEEVLSLCHSWRGCCGVLLFLYSVILTKVRQRNS